MVTWDVPHTTAGDSTLSGIVKPSFWWCTQRVPSPNHKPYRRRKLSSMEGALDRRFEQTFEVSGST